MKDTIRFPRTEGLHSRQAHCDLPEGTFEREFGKEGFFGPATHIIHANNPMGWVEWEGELKPRAYDLAKLTGSPDMPAAATMLLSNPHCKLRFWHCAASMPHLACNADGDELLFVHAGSGDLFCDFGHLTFREGDYILLPRSTRWRIECTEPCRFLMMEATNDSFLLPDKGLVGPHAIFDPAVLESPRVDDAFRAQQGPHRTEVHITRRGQHTRVVFPFNPLDALGWHGDNLVVKVNWRDIRPLMSHRYHLPPSAHTTFLTRRFVVCTFVPRLIETDPGALKVPFFHSNNDYDEVIFYHAGSFFSRDNIHPGMLTLHPAGFPHGPHPKAFATGAKATRTETDEVAVMIDTRDALDPAPALADVEWAGYVDSWKLKE